MKICLEILLFFILFGVVLGEADNRTKFDYLKVKGHTVETKHQARYKIKVGKSFQSLGEFHHQPIYENKQFNVSLAAFFKNEEIIMIHAETHTDGSGGLDYSNLKADSLNNLKFTSRDQCAPIEAEAELASNPEIKFLRGKGFSVVLPFYLKQYLTTAADGTAEVVISYGKHVGSCDEKTITDEFKKQIEQKVVENIKIVKD